MEKVLVGKLINTHALKGEVRIISNFKYLNRVFIVGKKLIINNDELTIKGYRVHKNYHMVIFEGINTIEEVSKYKNFFVYILREDLDLKEDEFLDSDLINLNVIYNNKLIGKIESIEDYNNKVIRVNNILIPFNDNFINEINIKENKIVLKNVGGLL